MIVKIKYTDEYGDKKIVYGILASLNIKIIKTKDYNEIITLYIENIEKVNTMLLKLNENTNNGVSLINCRLSLKEAISNLFRKNKKEK